jgi:hypothetical protein
MKKDRKEEGEVRRKRESERERERERDGEREREIESCHSSKMDCFAKAAKQLSFHFEKKKNKNLIRQNAKDNFFYFDLISFISVQKKLAVR